MPSFVQTEMSVSKRNSIMMSVLLLYRKMVQQETHLLKLNIP